MGGSGRTAAVLCGSSGELPSEPALVSGECLVNDRGWMSTCGCESSSSRFKIMICCYFRKSAVAVVS